MSILDDVAPHKTHRTNVASYKSHPNIAAPYQTHPNIAAPYKTHPNKRAPYSLTSNIQFPNEEHILNIGYCLKKRGCAFPCEKYRTTKRSNIHVRG